jgi:hypothetical protein
MAESKNIMISSLKIGQDTIGFDDFPNEGHAPGTDAIRMIVPYQVAEGVADIVSVLVNVAA